MADEQSAKPIMKYAIIAAAALVVVGAAVGGTLLATGALNDKPSISAEDALAELEGGADADETEEITVDPDAEPVYHEFERPLLTNVANSRKIVQAKVAVMTRDSEKVLPSVIKHDFALRSEALDVMRKITEADIDNPNFRDELSEKLKVAINNTLKRYAGHGGVEEVLFTELVVQ
ncbi:MAG: hypothetical protein RI942_273 [Pseudomonadota bacterium]|jgi:flagellar FliL protein